MNVDMIDIMRDAFLFSGTVQNERKLTEAEAIRRSKSVLFKSQFDQDIVGNIVLGAICAYHKQLREVLQNQGIDIGEALLSGESVEV